MFVNTAHKQQSRSSLPRPRLSSVYRETRRSLAASCELSDAAIVSFTGLNFCRIFDKGNSRNNCYSAGFEFTKLMIKGGTNFDIWGGGGGGEIFRTRPDRP